MKAKGAPRASTARNVHGLSPQTDDLRIKASQEAQAPARPHHRPRAVTMTAIQGKGA